MNGKEEEIYNILYKKKEIDDKTPKLRTEDEKKKLKSLSYKMRKFPKDLIDDIKKKFPFLQRTPKTAEQRKEQDKECHRQKRYAESELEKERRQSKDKITKHKRYTQATQFRAKKLQEVIEKRSKESEIERQRRLTQDKECHSRKRSAESDIDKEMRLTKDKITKHKRYTQATQFRAKKIQQLREKRSAESDIGKKRRQT